MREMPNEGWHSSATACTVLCGDCVVPGSFELGGGGHVVLVYYSIQVPPVTFCMY